MLRLEQYLSDFNSTVNIIDFLINIFVATILSLCIGYFYVRFGRSVSNRTKFAQTFVPLALVTLIIITVVKSSLALSLGLVGALSIVRFRAAIKEPEELIYLFMVIGLGLACGANKPLLAILGFGIVLLMVFLGNLFQKKKFSAEITMTTLPKWVI